MSKLLHGQLLFFATIVRDLKFLFSFHVVLAEVRVEQRLNLRTVLARSLRSFSESNGSRLRFGFGFLPLWFGRRRVLFNDFRLLNIEIVSTVQNAFGFLGVLLFGDPVFLGVSAGLVRLFHLLLDDLVNFRQIAGPLNVSVKLVIFSQFTFVEVANFLSFFESRRFHVKGDWADTVLTLSHDVFVGHHAQVARFPLHMSVVQLASFLAVAVFHDFVPFQAVKITEKVKNVNWVSKVDVGVSSVASGLEVNGQVEVVILVLVVLVDKALNVHLGESHGDVSHHDRRFGCLVFHKSPEVDLIRLGRRNVGAQLDSRKSFLVDLFTRLGGIRLSAVQTKTRLLKAYALTVRVVRSV